MLREGVLWNGVLRDYVLTGQGVMREWVLRGYVMRGLVGKSDTVSCTWRCGGRNYLLNKAVTRSNVLPRRVDELHKTQLSSPPPLPNDPATIGLLKQI